MLILAMESVSYWGLIGCRSVSMLLLPPSSECLCGGVALCGVWRFNVVAQAALRGVLLTAGARAHTCTKQRPPERPFHASQCHVAWSAGGGWECQLGRGKAVKMFSPNLLWPTSDLVPIAMARFHRGERGKHSLCRARTAPVWLVLDDRAQSVFNY
jgi:hypothetical protein